MCEPRHVKTGKTLLEFPVSDPMERVDEYIRQCHSEQNEWYDMPVVAGATCMQSYAVSKDLSVVYLLIQQRKRNVASEINNGETFGINIKCFPVGEHNRKCIVMPMFKTKELVLPASVCV